MISTAKFAPLTGELSGLATPSDRVTERKAAESGADCSLNEAAKNRAPQPAPSVTLQPIRSAEWSEESGSEDDLLLEDIINLGMPSGRPSTQPTKSKTAGQTSSTGIPKSASAHSLGRNSEFSSPNASRSCIPPSHSTDSSLTARMVRMEVGGVDKNGGGEHESDSDYSVDDDEMLYACIKSAMPKAKPAPPKRIVSAAHSKHVVSTSIPNGIQRTDRSRSLRPPMELPKPPIKEVGDFN